MVEIYEERGFLLQAISYPHVGKQDPVARVAAKLVKTGCVALHVNSTIHADTDGRRVHLVNV
jgi:hypothetical protein